MDAVEEKRPQFFFQVLSRKENLLGVLVEKLYLPSAREAAAGRTTQREKTRTATWNCSPKISQRQKFKRSTEKSNKALSIDPDHHRRRSDRGRFGREFS